MRERERERERDGPPNGVFLIVLPSIVTYVRIYDAN